MAICIDCGLEVVGGKLQVDLKQNGGIGCGPDGLFINFAPDSEGGQGLQVGCGLTASEAAIQIDIGTAPTCGATVENLLKCVEGDGLRVDHHYSIASNSAACGHGSEFLGIVPGPPGLPMVVSPIGYQFVTPLVTIKPDCICAAGNPAGNTYTWTGNTLFDVGGIQIEAGPNSLIEVTFTLHQGFLGDPVTFGGLNPSYRVTIDNRNFGFARLHDVVLHDTTWQVFGCGGIQFALRLQVEVLQGTGQIYSFTEQQYEINWHYSHAAHGTPPAVGHNYIQGCTTPPPGP